MGLFSKKMTIDEILKAIESLSDEEKAKVGEKMKELYPTDAKTETEVETEEVEEAEVKDGQEVKEEEQVEETVEKEEVPMEETAEEEAFDEEESARDEMAEDNRDEIIHQLTDKVNAAEARLKEFEAKLESFEELRAKMEEYTKKQAESFGYKGNLTGAKKDIQEMSLEELKARQMKGL